MRDASPMLEMNGHTHTHTHNTHKHTHRLCAGENKLGSHLHSHENLVASLTKWPFVGFREAPLYSELQKPESE